MLNIWTEYRVNQKHFSQLETGPMWIIMIKEGKTDVEYEIIMSCKLCIKERNNPWRITCFFNNWTNLAHKEIPSVWRRMTRLYNSVTYNVWFVQRYWMIRIAESPPRINTLKIYIFTSRRIREIIKSIELSWYVKSQYLQESSCCVASFITFSSWIELSDNFASILCFFFHPHFYY